MQDLVFYMLDRQISWPFLLVISGAGKHWVAMNRTNTCRGNSLYSGYLLKALGPDWPSLSEELGFWIPIEIDNTKHDDKPEGVEEPEQDILPGRQLPPECQAELHLDYDGVAVKWGLTHHRICLLSVVWLISSKLKMQNQMKRSATYGFTVLRSMVASPLKLNTSLGNGGSNMNAHRNAPLVVLWVSGLVSS